MRNTGHLLLAVAVLFTLTQGVSAVEVVDHLLGVTERITYSGGDCVLEDNILACELKPGDRFMITAFAQGDDELVKDACMLFSYSGVRVDRTSGLHSEPGGEDSGLVCTGSGCDPDKTKNCFFTLVGKEVKSVRVEGKVLVLGEMQVKSDFYVKTSRSTQRNEFFINIHSVECFSDMDCLDNKSCVGGLCLREGEDTTTSTTTTMPLKIYENKKVSLLDSAILYVKNLPEIVKLLVFTGIAFIILFFMHTHM